MGLVNTGSQREGRLSDKDSFGTCLLPGHPWLGVWMEEEVGDLSLRQGHHCFRMSRQKFREACGSREGLQLWKDILVGENDVGVTRQRQT